MEDLIIQSKIRSFLRGKGFDIHGDSIKKTEKNLSILLNKAVSRAKLNSSTQLNSR